MSKEPITDFVGFEAGDFHCELTQAGKSVSEDDACEWLEPDNCDPGYQMLSEEEIATEASASDDDGAHNVNDEEDEVPTLPRLSQVRQVLNVLVEYMGHPKALPGLLPAIHVSAIHLMRECHPSAAAQQPDAHNLGLLLPSIQYTLCTSLYHCRLRGGDRPATFNAVNTLCTPSLFAVSKHRTRGKQDNKSVRCHHYHTGSLPQLC